MKTTMTTKSGTKVSYQELTNGSYQITAKYNKVRTIAGVERKSRTYAVCDHIMLVDFMKNKFGLSI